MRMRAEEGGNAASRRAGGGIPLDLEVLDRLPGLLAPEHGQEGLRGVALERGVLATARGARHGAEDDDADRAHRHAPGDERLCEVHAEVSGFWGRKECEGSSKKGVASRRCRR